MSNCFSREINHDYDCFRSDTSSINQSIDIGNNSNGGLLFVLMVDFLIVS